ncbi:MAG: phosphatase PAP2 family protein [Bacteroidota bacterium]|nr:phosphatase PAP2 family protein [Candidatus Kapabacteria bacterium]MDW8220776.1 phosphatase PAP2 family protein [Bacteroidota bacterium]
MKKDSMLCYFAAIVASVAMSVQAYALADASCDGRLLGDSVLSTLGQRNVAEILWSDIRGAYDDAVAYCTAPIRFSARDWLITGAVLGSSAALIPFDQHINALMLRSRSHVADVTAEVGRYYGELWFGASVGIGLYGVGTVLGNVSMRRTGCLALEAVAFGGVLNLAIKALVGRSRPYVGEGALMARPFQCVDSLMSFPSGHTTVAFAVSSVLAECAGESLVSVGLYALAGLTAISRLYHTKHWASDIILGAAIGAGAGLFVTHLERERNAAQHYSRIMVYPTPFGIGLAMQLSE